MSPEGTGRGSRPVWAYHPSLPVALQVTASDRKGCLLPQEPPELPAHQGTVCKTTLKPTCTAPFRGCTATPSEVTCGLLGNSYDQQLRKKTLRVYRWCERTRGTSQQQVLQPTLHSDGPETAWGGEIQPGSGSLESTLGCTLCQGGEMAAHAELHPGTESSQCLVGWSGIWKEDSGVISGREI